MLRSPSQRYANQSSKRANVTRNSQPERKTSNPAIITHQARKQNKLEVRAKGKKKPLQMKSGLVTPDGGRGNKNKLKK